MGSTVHAAARDCEHFLNDRSGHLAPDVSLIGHQTDCTLWLLFVWAGVVFSWEDRSKGNPGQVLRQIFSWGVRLCGCMFAKISFITSCFDEWSILKTCLLSTCALPLSGLLTVWTLGWIWCVISPTHQHHLITLRKGEKEEPDFISRQDVKWTWLARSEVDVRDIKPWQLAFVLKGQVAKVEIESGGIRNDSCLHLSQTQTMRPRQKWNGQRTGFKFIEHLALISVTSQATSAAKLISLWQPFWSLWRSRRHD